MIWNYNISVTCSSAVGLHFWWLLHCRMFHLQKISWRRLRRLHKWCDIWWLNLIRRRQANSRRWTQVVSKRCPDYMEWSNIPQSLLWQGSILVDSSKWILYQHWGLIVDTRRSKYRNLRRHPDRLWVSKRWRSYRDRPGSKDIPWRIRCDIGRLADLRRQVHL